MVVTKHEPAIAVLTSGVPGLDIALLEANAPVKTIVCDRPSNGLAEAVGTYAATVLHVERSPHMLRGGVFDSRGYAEHVAKLLQADQHDWIVIDGNISITVADFANCWDRRLLYWIECIPSDLRTMALHGQKKSAGAYLFATGESKLVDLVRVEIEPGEELEEIRNNVRYGVACTFPRSIKQHIHNFEVRARGTLSVA